jgi:hypothetical protein
MNSSNPNLWTQPMCSASRNMAMQRHEVEMNGLLRRIREAPPQHPPLLRPTTKPTELLIF